MLASCPTDIKEPRKLVSWVSYQDPAFNQNVVLFERIVFDSVLSAAKGLAAIEAELRYRRSSLVPGYTVQLARLIHQFDQPRLLESCMIRQGTGH
jgi:hypothetical protein